MKINLSFLLILIFTAPAYGQTGLPQPHEPCGLEGQKLRYLEFSLRYSEENKQPFWVAYTLEREELDFLRAFSHSPFAEDPHLDTQGATLDDYRGSGYDRGHLTRASYNKRTEKTLRESYLLSGISPQIGIAFNRAGGAWYDAEEFEVRLAREKGIIYGISGPIFKNNIDTIGDNKVTVPGYFYKVIIYLDEDELWQGAGLLMKHRADSETAPEEFLVPIRKIEKKSGLDFNCFLPDSTQHRIEKAVWDMKPGEDMETDGDTDPEN